MTCSSGNTVDTGYCASKWSCTGGGPTPAECTQACTALKFTAGECDGSGAVCTNPATAGDAACGTGKKCCCTGTTPVTPQSCTSACTASGYTAGECDGPGAACQFKPTSAGTADTDCATAYGVTGEHCCCTQSTTSDQCLADCKTHSDSKGKVYQYSTCSTNGGTCTVYEDTTSSATSYCKTFTGDSTSKCCCGNCGDTVCDAGETSTNCATDCCPSGTSIKDDPQCTGSTGTANMKTIVDPFYETGTKTYRSCQSIRSIKVIVENASNNQVIVDRSIDAHIETSLPTTSDVCKTNSGAICNPVVGYAYFTQKFGKFTAPTDVVFTAQAVDNSGKSPKYVLTSPGTATVHVEPNKLKLNPHTSTNFYVWSTATKTAGVKSCEDITFGACVLDADLKKPTLPVTITFQFQDDTRKEEIKCTAPANDGCCTVAYTAPANTGAAKDFHLMVKATEPTCYADADPVPVTVNVAPVQLVITELKTDAPTAGVQAGKDVKAWAIVKNGKDASAKLVQGAEVTFTLKGPGTTTLTKTGTTGVDGKATVTFTPTVAGDYTLTAIAKVKVVAPTVACFTDSIETTAADKVKVTEPPGCDTLCSNNFVCVPTSQGCAAGQTAMATGNNWCNAHLSQPLCCCKP